MAGSALNGWASTGDALLDWLGTAMLDRQDRLFESQFAYREQHLALG